MFNNHLLINLIVSLLLTNLFSPVTGAPNKKTTAKTPVVELNGFGKITGAVGRSRENNQYFSYYAVPYGTIPGRFQVAKRYTEKLKSETSFDSPGDACVHYDLARNRIIGTEDCLTLDVHTRDVKKQSPVIVYFAPGGFQSRDNSTTREVMFFMDFDVVFVQISSRLGALGYLNTGDGEVNGNMGLKDQVLALQWIQTHIQSFGGLRSSVELLGVSSGAATAVYHMLSPMSVGLFSRVMAISGAPLNPWAIQHAPARLFENFISKTTCKDKKSSKERISCLKKLSVSNIIQAQTALAKLTPEFDMMNMRFVPSIESENQQRPFLDKHPRFLMQTKQVPSKVPLVIGFTQNEGSFYTAMLSIRPASIKKLNDEWTQMAPSIFHLDEYPMLKAAKIITQMKKFYFPGGSITSENINKLSNLFADRYIINGVTETILLLQDLLPVYPYQFKHLGKKSMIQYFFKDVHESQGVSHLDELLYLFNDTVGASEAELGGSEYRKFSKRYVDWVVRFAKSGIPQDTFFDPSTGDKSPHLWTRASKGKPLTLHEINYSVEGPQQDRPAFSDDVEPIDISAGHVPHPSVKRVNFWTALRRNEEVVIPTSDQLQFDSASGTDAKPDQWTTLEPFQYGKLNNQYNCIRFDWRDMNVCVRLFTPKDGQIKPLAEILFQGTTPESPSGTTDIFG